MGWKNSFLLALAGWVALPMWQPISQPAKNLLQSPLRFFIAGLASSTCLTSFLLVLFFPPITGSVSRCMCPLALADSTDSGFLLPLTSHSCVFLNIPTSALMIFTFQVFPEQVVSLSKLSTKPIPPLNNHLPVTFPSLTFIRVLQVELLSRTLGVTFFFLSFSFIFLLFFESNDAC